MGTLGRSLAAFLPVAAQLAVRSRWPAPRSGCGLSAHGVPREWREPPPRRLRSHRSGERTTGFSVSIARHVMLRPSVRTIASIRITPLAGVVRRAVRLGASGRRTIRLTDSQGPLILDFQIVARQLARPPRPTGRWGDHLWWLVPRTAAGRLAVAGALDLFPRSAEFGARTFSWRPALAGSHVDADHGAVNLQADGRCHRVEHATGPRTPSPPSTLPRQQCGTTLPGRRIGTCHRRRC